MRWAILCATVLLCSPAWLSAAEAVTFANRIAEIVHHKCMECHRRGGAAPFALNNYAEVTQHAPHIREALRTGSMPPWQPKGNLHEFKGDRRLTAEEERAWEMWFQTGMLEGNRDDQPQPPFYALGWQLGKPNFILQPKPLALGNHPASNIQVAELPREEDGWVTAVELQPKQPGFQHALLWLDLPTGTQVMQIETTEPDQKSWLAKSIVWRNRFLLKGTSPFRPVQRARAVEARDRRLLGVWSFDHPAQIMPPGAAFRFPAGSRLVVETSLSSEPVPVEIGLHLSTEPLKNLAISAALEPRPTNLLGVQNDQPWSDAWRVPVACELHSIAPHTSGPCREVRVNLTLPSGKTEPLLWIDRWNERWERPYAFHRPIQIPKGSRLDTRFVFSASGPETPQQVTLLAALLTPVNPAEYDELILSIQRHQIEVAQQPLNSGNLR
jgi:hypothetical protein